MYVKGESLLHIAASLSFRGKPFYGERAREKLQHISEVTFGYYFCSAFLFIHQLKTA